VIVKSTPFCIENLNMCCVDIGGSAEAALHMHAGAASLSAFPSTGAARCRRTASCATCTGGRALTVVAVSLSSHASDHCAAISCSLPNGCTAFSLFYLSHHALLSAHDQQPDAVLFTSLGLSHRSLCVLGGSGRSRRQAVRRGGRQTRRRRSPCGRSTAQTRRRCGRTDSRPCTRYEMSHAAAGHSVHMAVKLTPGCDECNSLKPWP